MATLKDVRVLIADIEARPPGSRSLTKQDYSDLGQSLSTVGGTLSIKDGTSAIVTSAGWNRLDIFDTSRDTQGVKEGLAEPSPGSYFRVLPAGEGLFICALDARIEVDVDGIYEFRITLADDDDIPGVFESSPSQFHDKLLMTSGQPAKVSITGAIFKDVKKTNLLHVEYKGPNGSQVIGRVGQFHVVR